MKQRGYRALPLLFALALALTALPALTIPARAEENVRNAAYYWQVASGCVSGGTVVLSKDVEDGKDPVWNGSAYTSEMRSASGTIEVGHDTIIDLNGHSMISNNISNVTAMFRVHEGVHLTIRDSSPGGTGRIGYYSGAYTALHFLLMEPDSVYTQEGGTVTLGGPQSERPVVFCSGAVPQGTLDDTYPRSNRYTVNLLGGCIRQNSDGTQAPFYSARAEFETLETLNSSGKSVTVSPSNSCSITNCELTIKHMADLFKYIAGNTAIWRLSKDESGNKSWYRVSHSIGFSAGAGDAGYASSLIGFKVTTAETSPLITAYDYPSGVTGEVYSDYVPAAENATQPLADKIVWSATGLPDGLKISASTGQLTGTPEKAGTFNVNLTATNRAGSDSVSFLIRIASAQATASVDGNNPSFGGDTVAELRAALLNPDVYNIKLNSDIYRATDALTADNSYKITDRGLANGYYPFKVAGAKKLDLNGHSVKYDVSRGAGLIYIPHGASLTVTDSRGGGELGFISQDTAVSGDLREEYKSPTATIFAEGDLTVDSGWIWGGNSWSVTYRAINYRKVHNGIAACSSSDGSIRINGGSFEGYCVYNDSYSYYGGVWRGSEKYTNSGAVSGYNITVTGGSFTGRGGGDAIRLNGGTNRICGGVYKTKELHVFCCFDIAGVPRGQTVQGVTISPDTAAALDCDYVQLTGVSGMTVVAKNVQPEYFTTEDTRCKTDAVVVPKSPSASVTPEFAKAYDRQKCIFVCTAEPQAGGTLSYQWYRDGKAIPAETYSYYSFTPFVVDANREYDEELNGTYGVFSCRVTESTSGLTTEAKAQAYFSSKKPEPLTMTISPEETTVKAGESVTLTATPGGNLSALSGLSVHYMWYRMSDDGTATSTLVQSTTSNKYVFNTASADVGKTFRFACVINGKDSLQAQAAANVNVSNEELSIAIDTDTLVFKVGETYTKADDKRIAVIGNISTGGAYFVPRGDTSAIVGGLQFSTDGYFTGTPKTPNDGYIQMLAYPQQGSSVSCIRTVHIIVVTKTLTIGTGSPLPDGYVNGTAAYYEQLELKPYTHYSDDDFEYSYGCISSGDLTWTVAAGSVLPDGLRLTTDGELRGVPTASGGYYFKISVRDNKTDISASRWFYLAIKPAAGIGYSVGNEAARHAMEDTTTINLMTTDANERYKYCVYLYPENGGTLTMSDSSASFELTEIEKGRYCLKNKQTLGAYSGGYKVALKADCGGSGTFTCQLTLSVNTDYPYPKITTTQKDIDSQVASHNNSGQKSNFWCADTPGDLSVSIAYRGYAGPTTTLGSLYVSYYDGTAMATPSSLTGLSISSGLLTWTRAGMIEALGEHDKIELRFGVKVTNGDIAAKYISDSFDLYICKQVTGPTAISTDSHTTLIASGSAGAGEPYVSRNVEVGIWNPGGCVDFTSDAIPGASFTASGLPDGLSIRSDGQVVGVTDVPAGVYTVTVTATNVMNATITKTAKYNIHVVDASQATAPTVSLDSGTYDAAQTLTITCDAKYILPGTYYNIYFRCFDKNGAPLHINGDGHAVSGLAAVDGYTVDTVQIWGNTPSITVDRTMTFEFWTPGLTFGQRDSEKVAREYIINNDKVISVTPASLPDAKLNTEYSQQLTAKDVSGKVLSDVTFTCTQGLPYGIDMSTIGLISGKATGLNNLGENHVFFNVSKEGYTTEYCALTLNVYDKDAVSAHAANISLDSGDATLKRGKKYTVNATATNVYSGETASVAWFQRITDADGVTTYSRQVGAGGSFTVPTSNTGSMIYYAEATSTGDGLIPAVTDSVDITITVSDVAQTPVFDSEDVVTVTFYKGQTGVLDDRAVVADGGTLNYQWQSGTYVESTKTFTAGELVTTTEQKKDVELEAAGLASDGTVTPVTESRTYAEMTVPTGTVGTSYYRCTATNTNTTLAEGFQTASASGGVYKVEVLDPNTPSSLVVTKQPTKTTYKVGERINLDGIEAYVSYPNDVYDATTGWSHRTLIEDTTKITANTGGGPSLVTSDALTSYIISYTAKDGSGNDVTLTATLPVTVETSTKLSALTAQLPTPYEDETVSHYSGRIRNDYTGYNVTFSGVYQGTDPATEGTWMADTDTDTFTAGTSYVVRVGFPLKVGYELAGGYTVSINGKTGSEIYQTSVTSRNYAYRTAVTAVDTTKPVELVITKQPDKTNYKVGETFILTGIGGYLLYADNVTTTAEDGAVTYTHAVYVTGFYVVSGGGIDSGNRILSDSVTEVTVAESGTNFTAGIPVTVETSTKLGEIDVTLPALIAGKTVGDYKAKTLTGGTGYSVSCGLILADTVGQDDNAAFVKGTTYTLQITITLDAGYQFADGLKTVVNGKDVSSGVTEPAVTARSYTFTTDMVATDGVTVSGGSGTYGTDGYVPGVSAHSTNTTWLAGITTVTLKKDGTTVASENTTQHAPVSNASQEDYSFDAVQEGTYTLTVEKPHFAPVTVTVTVTGTDLSAATVNLYMWGDVNEDGKVNSTDAIWIRQNSAGSRTFDDDYQNTLGDLNKDGKVNSTDAIWARQVSAGSRTIE